MTWITDHPKYQRLHDARFYLSQALEAMQQAADEPPPVPELGMELFTIQAVIAELTEDLEQLRHHLIDSSLQAKPTGEAP